jgi:hypothetical protein
MPYLNLDDNFADHPKVDRLSDAAFRLHVAGMLYAAKHLTNGKIPADRPPRLVPKFKPTILAELFDAGLWRQNGVGYEIHDYLDWNKSREWWEKKRAADAERRRKWREANGGKEDPDVTP